jgi:N-acetylglucosaminyl-diphospho-decaprenol L-rhamnosyltransferase
VKVVAVTVNWNQAQLTSTAALSVRGEVDAVVIVDNGSSEDQRHAIRRLASLGDDVIVVESASNLRYAAGANLGIATALEREPEAVLIMNNDVEADAGAVRRLARRLAEAPDTAIVAPLIADTSGRKVLHSHCFLDERTGRPSWREHGAAVAEVDTEPRETDWVSGEAFLLRADVLRQLGGFDERYVAYFEDADLSMRLRRAGWRLEVVPAAVFKHAYGASGAAARGVFYRTRNQTLFLRWALGRSRLSSSLLGGYAAAAIVLPLVARCRLLRASGAAMGWAVGAARVMTERSG